MHIPGGNGKRDADRVAARRNKAPNQRTLRRRAKKAHEAAAAAEYDNVASDPHADDIGDVDIHDISANEQKTEAWLQAKLFGADISNKVGFVGSHQIQFNS